VLRNIEAREPTSYDYDMMGEAQKRTDKRMGVVRDEKGVRVE
jgi:hypothetical protein